MASLTRQMDAALELRSAKALLPQGRKAFGFAGALAFLSIVSMPLLGASAALQLLSPVLILAGLGIACFAWLRSKTWGDDAVTAWDFGGLAMLLGFVAALVGEPSILLALR